MVREMARREQRSNLWRVVGAASTILLAVAVAVFSVFAWAQDGGDGGDLPKAALLSGTKVVQTPVPTLPADGVGTEESAVAALEATFPGADALIEAVKGGAAGAILDASAWTTVVCLDEPPRGGLQPVCEMLGVPPGTEVEALDISSPEIQMSAARGMVADMLDQLLMGNAAELEMVAWHRGDTALLAFELSEQRTLAPEHFLGDAPKRWLVIELARRADTAIVRLLPLDDRPTPLAIWRSENDYAAHPYGLDDVLLATAELLAADSGGATATSTAGPPGTATAGVED